MASSKRVPGIPPVVTPPDTIHLELSLEEATVLKALCGVVGGATSGSDPTVRVQVDAINKALCQAGVGYPSFDNDKKLFNGSTAQSQKRLADAVNESRRSGVSGYCY